ncbi:MAG TPA: trypsin-like peptidase domain-containing protein [Candidatus Sulfotelmatobacter sp.]|nr:trypsin-like peptidase domain-containing protein [Candidatus Sulfotelmatobacter sp.]
MDLYPTPHDPTPQDPRPEPGQPAETPTGFVPGANPPHPPSTPLWWSAPAPPPTQPTVAAPPPRRPRRGAGFASLFTAALLGAVLASGGTFVTLEAVGVGTAPTAAPAATTSADSADQASAKTASGDPDADIVAAAAKVSPAVVTITSTGTTSNGFGRGFQTTGVGSGTIFDSAGWILTNRHVVDGATNLSVQLADGRTFTGTIYGESSTSDLAIVKIDATGLPTAAVGDSSQLVVGQRVIAIGDPLGDFQSTVTSGIVSGLGRSIDVENEHLSGLIQTDAAINPGNSGGPLLDTAGNIVGINTATASTAQGISFAIPVAVAKPLMAAALAGQPIP